MTAPGLGPAAARLEAIDCWVFDLDNTLYPASSNLFGQIDRRMGRFIGEALGLPADDARALQKRYFRDYGTTLNGLMHEHDVDPHAYLAFVHDIDLGVLAPAPRLDEALAALAGRKVIYTNGSAAHAGRVLERLGIARHFSGVVDIVTSDFEPKPGAAAFRRMLDHLAIAPARAAMVEDLAQNLAPAREHGMVTVWLRGSGDWSAPDAGAVDYAIDDLADWLASVAGGD